VRRTTTAAEVREKQRSQALAVRSSRRENSFTNKRFRQSSSSPTQQRLNAHVDQSAGTLDATLRDIARSLQQAQGNVELGMAAMLKLRTILSRPNPPIGAVVDLNIMTELVLFLQSKSAAMQGEVTWCITNMASGGSHDATLHILPSAPLILQAIEGGSLNLAAQGWWALGNMAGDGDECRGYLLNIGSLRVLVASLTRAKVTLASAPGEAEAEAAWGLCRVAAWAISNLARGGSSFLPFQKAAVVPLLLELLDSSDAEVKREVLWAFAFLTAKEEAYVHTLVMDYGLARVLCQRASELDFARPADVAVLRSLGNLSAGPVEWVDALMREYTLLPTLCGIVASDVGDRSAVKDAVWVAANLLGAEERHRGAVLTSSLLPLIVDKVLPSGFFDAQREAIFAIECAVRDASVLGGAGALWSAGGAQAGQLLTKGDLLDCILKLATMHDVEVGLACLRIIRALAMTGRKTMLKLIDAGACDVLDSLQYNSGNEEVSRLAEAVAEEMEEEEDSDDGIAPATLRGDDGGRSFAFGSGVAVQGATVFDFGGGGGGGGGGVDGGGGGGSGSGGRGRGRGAQLPAWMTSLPTAAAPGLAGAVRAPL